MADYTLHYWPIAFRGQFVRATLAHVGAEWDEADMDGVVEAMSAPPERQHIPFMGPPMLTDHRAGVTLAQMPAILGYLGRAHGLMPGDLFRAALTDKAIADANDVLYEMTRYNGAQMWTAPDWAEYRPRLARWMTIFEETGRRHGLGPDTGHLLGGDAPGLADLVAHVLWGTMTEKLPALRPMLEETAPRVAALSDRIGALPDQAALRARSAEQFGPDWCAGEIEASLRAVL